MGRMCFDPGLSNNPIATVAVRELAGVERIVFGTDWPYAVLPEGGDASPDLGPAARAAGAGEGVGGGVTAAARVPRRAAARGGCPPPPRPPRRRRRCTSRAGPTGRRC